MALIKTFQKISKSDTAIAGGKGASLGEMTQADILVPPGFVILADAFEKFLEETDLNVEIDSILHSVDHRKMHTIENVSEKIKALILNAEIPKYITSEIQKFFKGLNTQFVAVRSSATAEDSSTAAWAGQLESYLNTTKQSLLENVKKCWASLFTPRAIFYRFEKELHKQKISVAVVVQKMVTSESSGVAFSVHPVTQDKNQLIIEAGFGLGEAIVSGEITPDSYVIEKRPRQIIDKNIQVQAKGLYRSAKGGNKWINILKRQGEKQVLSDNEILRLSKIILRIEKHYGFPCDIEWAYENGKFYITQSRPITTLSAIATPQKRKIDKKLWCKNFSIDNLPTLQLISFVLDFGMRYGHEALFGKKYPLFIKKSFMRFVGNDLEGGYFKDYELEQLVQTTNKLIYKNPTKISKNHKLAYAWNDRYFAYAKKCIAKNLEKLSDRELANIYNQLTILQEKAHMHAINSTWFVDSHGSVFSDSLMEKTKSIISRAHSKLNPANVFTILTTPAVNSLAIKEEIESLKIVEKILRDKKSRSIFKNLRTYKKIPPTISTPFKNSMIAHCSKWHWMPFGYLGPAYDIDYYLSVWAGLIRENINPQKLIKEKQNRPHEIQKKRTALFKELGIPLEMKMIYDVAADIAFLKGYRKDCVYFGFYTIDYLYKEITKRLGISLSEVHWLTYQEIIDLLNGNINFDKAEIIKRKQTTILYWNGRKTKIFSGIKAKQFFKSQTIKKEIVELSTDSLKGTCACSGYARGKVKIINKAEEMYKMKMGDIMVSHTTFPSLVPAMKKATAIVTEDGGITCHAAIVARELKTPCVVGIKTATQILKDGTIIEVFADDGIVKILK